MASLFKNFPFPTSFLLIFLISLHFSRGISIEFEVGGDRTWAVPSSKNSDFYNDWASKNRFKVNDTLSFKFEEDSVMVVNNQEEYKKCHSSHPLFFSNNGNNTVYRLDRPGFFYFVSGLSQHCERGLKMIVKVLDIESPPQSANDRTASGSSSLSPTKFGGLVNFVAILACIFSLFEAILILICPIIYRI